MQNSTLQVNEIEVETSFGVSVLFSKQENNSFKQSGVVYPKSWTDPELSGSEFELEETIDEAVLEGRIEGAKREAEVHIACETDAEDSRTISDGFVVQPNITKF